MKASVTGHLIDRRTTTSVMSLSRKEVQDYIDDLEGNAEEIEEQARRFFSSLDTEKKRVRASIMSNKKRPRHS